MFPRPEKLIRCSPYYSSSLSSESPPIQPMTQPPVQKPPRKTSLPRNMAPKSPPSGNDTDSSLDLRQQDPKLRSRGYRKKRTVPLKKTRLDNRPLEHQESSECSEGYFPEIESGSSDVIEHQYHRYPDFEEELEQLPEDYEDETYHVEDERDSKNGGGVYPSASYSNKFEGLDMTENVDEMGFPRYDRLGHITNPNLYKSDTPSPPVKPLRQRKRQVKRDEVDTEYAGVQYTPESGSCSETKAGLSDDVCYSSEDSFAAAYQHALIGGARYQKNVEIPYPDFLSDYENESSSACSYARRMEHDRRRYVEKEHGSGSVPSYPESDKSAEGSLGFDLKALPPPMFDEEQEEQEEEDNEMEDNAI
ncbi:hypothetical protein RP20_CCG010387 [Aedes albopictus]|nr:hypothetical protein RP20_CCG010387 [Aedes albopictus]